MLALNVSEDVVIVGAKDSQRGMLEGDSSSLVYN